MQVKVTYDKPTQATVTVIPTTEDLATIKKHTLTHFQADAKLPGFREGKAPLEMVEKSADPNHLQTQFLEEAINQLYPQAARAENLRAVAQPEISIKKFVPFTQLEFEAVVPVISEIKLPDYKKIRKTRKAVKVTAEDVNQVVKSLQTRLASKNTVERPAKKGDEVWIDFKGVNSKGEPIKGADGKDYPLLLGSNTFIPGFEDNVIGLRAGKSKGFELTFPKDYGVKALANKKVTFTVSVTKVQELVEPKLDDEFAAKAGPFKTLKELKEDIKKQLANERERQTGLDYESELVAEITSKSKLEVPESLVDQQIDRLFDELKQNLTYRGMTVAEFFESEATTEEKYRQEVLKPKAEDTVKASVVLTEVAEKEKIEVTPEELEIRLQALKSQYTDPSMQSELDKPEARREIAYRMLSEKTVAQLAQYASRSS